MLHMKGRGKKAPLLFSLLFAGCAYGNAVAAPTLEPEKGPTSSFTLYEPSGNGYLPPALEHYFSGGFTSHVQDFPEGKARVETVDGHVAIILENERKTVDTLYFDSIADVKGVDLGSDSDKTPGLAVWYRGNASSDFYIIFTHGAKEVVAEVAYDLLHPRSSRDPVVAEKIVEREIIRTEIVQRKVSGVPLGVLETICSGQQNNGEYSVTLVKKYSFPECVSNAPDVPALADIPPLPDGAWYVVCGNASEPSAASCRPEEYTNFQLSWDRAEAVRQRLEQLVGPSVLLYPNGTRLNERSVHVYQVETTTGPLNSETPLTAMAFDSLSK